MNLITKLSIGFVAMISTASATANLSALWDFIREITDNADLIIGVIVLVAIIYIVRKFGRGLGEMLNITANP